MKNNKKSFLMAFMALFVLFSWDALAASQGGILQSKRPHLVFFALDPARDRSIEAYAKLGVFGVFDVFGLQDVVPDVSHNPIIQKAQADGKIFLACMGIPFKGDSKEAMRENLVRYLEAPFKKDAAWSRQGLVFSGIKLDELSAVFREDGSRGQENRKIDVLRDALKVFKKDYPDKVVFMWGVSQLNDKFDRVFQEVVSPYVDYYIPEIYIHEVEFNKVESRILSSLRFYKRFDGAHHTRVASKVIIGLGFFTAPETSLDDLPNKDYKIHMEKQLWAIQNHRYDEENAEDTDTRHCGVAVYNARLLKQDEVRWMVELLDHYVVKGNVNWIGAGSPKDDTDLLLKNPSFEDAQSILDPRFGWRCETGRGGALRVQSNEDANIAIPRYETTHGKVPQPSRTLDKGGVSWTARVLSMTRGASPSVVSQSMTLDPGKVYSLEAFVRYKDNSNAIIPGDVSIKNAAIISSDKKFVPIKGKNGQTKKENTYNWAQIYMVFRPEQPQIEVRLTDKAAREHDEIVWDFIQVQPYYVGSPAGIAPVKDQEVL